MAKDEKLVSQQASTKADDEKDSVFKNIFILHHVWNNKFSLLTKNRSDFKTQ